MLEKLKLLLGEAAGSYTDAQLQLILDITIEEVGTYCCSAVIDSGLEFAILQIAIIKLNRMNTEGLASQSFSGVSESFIDGYPKEIQAVLNRKRKMKTL